MLYNVCIYSNLFCSKKHDHLTTNEVYFSGCIYTYAYIDPVVFRCAQMIMHVKSALVGLMYTHHLVYTETLQVNKLTAL